MKRLPAVCGYLMLALVLIPALSSYSQLAETAWPMFHHDLKHTGLSEYAGPSVPVLAWSYLTSNSVTSSPALGSDGRVYVGSDDENLYALISDSSLLWSYRTGSYISSSPALGSDGRVYVGSNNSNLYAFNSNGALTWSYETGIWGTASPALGSDGRVYVGSNDCNLYAINSNGALTWS
ncbi:MAG: PQQ-binding-like beta-propeller repeat protein [Candidatus Aureabacteria bacterium]|nr:PQQ-binding-like beta-propeller repeat protein [Candidatus Auribacterota bacterium]